MSATPTAPLTHSGARSRFEARKSHPDRTRPHTTRSLNRPAGCGCGYCVTGILEAPIQELIDELEEPDY